MSGPPAKAVSNRQLFAIWVTQFNQAVCITLPYSLTAYMVRDFMSAGAAGGDTDALEQVIGSEAGLLASMFAVGQFLSSYPWGWASDYVGRKFVIVSGSVVTSLSMLGLGMAATYPQAMALRFLGGFLNGTIGALKTCIAESFEPQQQARAMGFLSFGWGAGAIVGPAAGGLLAHPCSIYQLGSLCAPGTGLFDRDPYLLPCLLGVAASTVSFGCAALCLQESLPAHRNLLVRAAQRACGALVGLWSWLQDASAESPRSVLSDACPMLPPSPAKGLRWQRLPSSEACTPVPSMSPRPSAALLLPSPTGKATGRTQRPPAAEAVAPAPPGDHPCSPKLPPASPRRSPFAWGPGSPAKSAEHKALQLSLHGSQTGLLIGTSITPDEAASGRAVPTGPAAPPSPGGAAGGSKRRLQAAMEAFDACMSSARSSTPREGDAAAAEDLVLLTAADLDDAEEAAAASPVPAQAREHRARSLELRSPRSSVAIDAWQPEEDSGKPWYRDRLVVSLICGYGCIAFLFTLLDELLPIFASTPPRHNGLGYSSEDLGLPLSVGGVALVLSALVLYPRLDRAYGPSRCTQLGLASMCLVALLFPCSTLLAAAPHHFGFIWFTLVVVVRNVSANVAFTSCMIMVNVAAPQKQIGSVNGAGQTAAAFVRGAAPTLAGVIWSLSVMTNLPGVHFLVFACVSLLALGAYVIYGHVGAPYKARCASQTDACT